MPLILLVLSLAAYRVTRFIVEDSMIEEPRKRLLKWILGKDGWTQVATGEVFPTRDVGWRVKGYELLTCPYCMSVWVSAGSVILASMTWEAPQPFWLWLGTCAGAMVVWRVVESE